MATIEFKVGGYIYHARLMNVFVQMQVVSKLSPLFAAGFIEIVSIFMQMREEGLSIANAPVQKAMTVIKPVAAELANMPPDHQRYVISQCMAVCDRKPEDGGAFSPIWSDQAGMSMYQDLNEDLSATLQICLGVIDGTFRRFFPESVSTFLDTLKQQVLNPST